MGNKIINGRHADEAKYVDYTSFLLKVTHAHLWLALMYKGQRKEKKNHSKHK